MMSKTSSIDLQVPRTAD